MSAEMGVIETSGEQWLSSWGIPAEGREREEHVMKTIARGFQKGDTNQ